MGNANVRCKISPAVTEDSIHEGHQREEEEEKKEEKTT
jgi:hypothetical protein